MKPFRALQSHTELIYQSLLLVIFLIVLLPGVGMTSSAPTRFFRFGDGQIHIKNEKDGREAKVNLFDPKGTLNEKALKEIDGVFNFPNTSKDEHVSLRLLFFLDYFSDIVAPSKMIHLVSGYRSPSYNEKLKKSGGNVAKTSTHIDGMAIDFFIEGIDGKILWETIRKENCCGIGHYGGKVVHLDSGKPRFWEATTSKVGTQESEFNRRVYLSTEYDRYKRGERVRFFLTSVSDFQFGIQKMATLVNDFEGKNRPISLSVQTQPEEECIVINNRTASRFIYSTFPVEAEQGRYRVRVDFCKRPFEQMPSVIFSNEIEIVRD
ncbi:MAG: hypothetical protein H6Q54_614 [Deltaproteobacteria bacterium]|nr:hypothetical protein [Deltaproteobacteria bacterium]